MRSCARVLQYLCLTLLLSAQARATPAQTAPTRVGSAEGSSAVRAALEDVLGNARWGIGERELAKALSQRSDKGHVGAATASEASFVGNELTHHDAESLLVSRDQTSKTFYVFEAGRLWKVYRVFAALVFPEGNFTAFAERLQRRFGRGKEAHAESSPGSYRRWIEWRAGTTRLRTVDESNAGGFYCLIFEDMEVVRKNAKAHRAL